MLSNKKHNLEPVLGIQDVLGEEYDGWDHIKNNLTKVKVIKTNVYPPCDRVDITKYVGKGVLIPDLELSRIHVMLSADKLYIGYLPLNFEYDGKHIYDPTAVKLLFVEKECLLLGTTIDIYIQAAAN